MISRDEIEKMNRKERIQKELESAKEYGITPSRDIGLDPDLSAQSSTPTRFSAGSTIPPTDEEARYNDHDFKAMATDFDTVPDFVKPIVFKDSPKALEYNIQADLDRLERRNRQQLLPRIVGQLRDLQIQTGEPGKFTKLQERVSKALFSTGEFEDIKGEKGGGISPSDK